jgi:tetratricopeptide (TPR) repeat protein
LYLSGDLYERAEECFQRVLEDPVKRLARNEERGHAELGRAQVLLARGQLTLAREALERAEGLLSSSDQALLEVRKLQCQRELHLGRYREVVDSIEATLDRETAETLGDGRVDFMLIEGRARHLLGRNRQASRLLEKAFEIAQNTGYEAGMADARSELAVLHVTQGQFKRAQEHLTEAIRSAEGLGSLVRLDRDRSRLGALLLRMGRWDEAAQQIRSAYESSRDLHMLENRLVSQLALADLQGLRGESEEARELALDAMEAARAAGYVRLHVEGLALVGQLSLELNRADEALEFLREAETLYTHLSPESSTMVQIQFTMGRALEMQGEHTAAVERLMRAHNVARETGNVYDRSRVDGLMGQHFAITGAEDKGATLLAKAAADLGSLGAKYDVAVTRLWFARHLIESQRRRSHEERTRENKLARSNLFEARRLLEAMGAQSRLAEIATLESRLQQLPAASSD